MDEYSQADGKNENCVVSARDESGRRLVAKTIRESLCLLIYTLNDRN